MLGPIGWVDRSVHSLPGWTLPPAVDLIHDAFNQFPGCSAPQPVPPSSYRKKLASSFSHDVRRTRTSLRPLGSFSQEVTDICQSEKRTRPQAATARVLLPRFFPLEPEVQFARRIRLWINAALPDDLFVRLTRSLAVLSGFPPSVLLSVYKWWCNAVPTTFRTHSPLWPCRFGCTDQTDRLTHYLVCPAVWPAVCRLAELSVPVSACLALALPDPLTDTDDIRKAALAIHIIVDTIQNTNSGRYIRPMIYLNEAARRARLLRIGSL